MNLTKQQRAGAAVAVLAVGVLGADRLLLGGGSPATASAQGVATGPPSGEPSQASGVQAVAMPRANAPSFARQLEQFASQNTIAPESGIPEIFGETAGPDVEQTVPEWTVSAVIGAGERGGVRIGDEFIRVGQPYRGATLVFVNAEGGVFAQGDSFFSAELVRPKPSNTPGQENIERVHTNGLIELETENNAP